MRSCARIAACARRRMPVTAWRSFVGTSRRGRGRRWAQSPPPEDARFCCFNSSRTRGITDASPATAASAVGAALRHHRHASRKSDREVMASPGDERPSVGIWNRDPGLRPGRRPLRVNQFPRPLAGWMQRPLGVTPSVHSPLGGLVDDPSGATFISWMVRSIDPSRRKAASAQRPAGLDHIMPEGVHLIATIQSRVRSSIRSRTPATRVIRPGRASHGVPVAPDVFPDRFHALAHRTPVAALPMRVPVT